LTSVERAERERVERERAERERLESERAEQDQTEQDRAEQEILHGRLKPIETSYHQDLRCMDGTRQSFLDQLMAWVTTKPGQNDETNTYWVYGLPGIGKTSLAHSICASLHDREQLAGAFFCRRDDINLSEPRNILLTLTYKLARTFPPLEANDPRKKQGN